MIKEAIERHPSPEFWEYQLERWDEENRLPKTWAANSYFENCRRNIDFIKNILGEIKNS